MVWWPDYSQESGAHERSVRLPCASCEEDQSVPSTKLPLCAYSTETSAAVGEWVLLERNDNEQTGGGSRSGRAEQSAGRFRSRTSKNGRVSSRGRALTPNVRKVDHFD